VYEHLTSNKQQQNLCMWTVSAYNLYELAQICNKSWGSYSKQQVFVFWFKKGWLAQKTR